MSPGRGLAAALFASALLMAAAGCARREPHPYPDAALSAFSAQCPVEQEVCACTWDQITHALPYEDYEAALERFRVEGLMDPRITAARTHCREKHAG